MADESRDTTSGATTSGDHSPAASASHSGTGDIHIDQSVTYGNSTKLTYEGERLLGKTVEELTGHFQTHTSIQAERLVKPFIGKPLRAEGKIINIKRYYDAVIAHLADGASDMILAYFPLSLEDRLAEPNLGDPLALMGRIQEINESGVTLLDCQLIEQ